MAATARAPLKVLGCQIANRDATTKADRDANIADAVAFLREHPGHEVYVLPEMWSVGYSDEVMVAVESGELAEDAATGPCFAALSPVAKELNAFVVYGFPRLDVSGSGKNADGEGAPEGAEQQEGRRRPTISENVIGPDGTLVATYDKLHLCSFGDCSEGRLFRPGDHLTVFEAQRGFRVGVLICYDVRFPEPWRKLAHQLKVDIVLHPSAFPDDGSQITWHPFVITRAVENQIYVLSLSRGQPHFGNSIAVGPRASDTPSRLDKKQGTLPVLVDPAAIAEARAEYSFRADLREDYDDLADKATVSPSAASSSSSSSSS